jgi:hypothetical protein
MTRTIFTFGTDNKCTGICKEIYEVPKNATWHHSFTFSVYADEHANFTLVKFNQPVALDFVCHLQRQFIAKVSCEDDDLLKIELANVTVQQIENSLLQHPFTVS